MTLHSATDRRSYLLETLSALSFDASGSRVALRIAGVRVDLLTHSQSTAQRIREYFADYLDQDGVASGILALEPLSAPRGLPELWEDADAEFDFRGEQVVQRDFAAQRIIGGGEARAVARISDESDDSLHNLLRWFMPNLLLKQGAFLMHAAGVVRDGFGYVFFGQSGAGKSTTAGLIHASDEGAVLLGDDAVIIAMSDAGPLVYSAPLGCGYSRVAPPALSAPLAGLFSLRQASHEWLEPLTRSEAVAALVASAMHTSCAALAVDRFDLATRFASAGSGVRALHFARDPAFWPLVLAGSEDSKSTRRLNVIEAT